MTFTEDPDHVRLVRLGADAVLSWRRANRSLDLRLDGADLRKADLSGFNLCRANFRGARLREADFRGALLVRADLTGADLRGARLDAANLCGADLKSVRGTAASLRDANLRDVDLTEADLRRADLRGARLDARLDRADLRRANLTGARLAGAGLTGANLARADLTDTDLGFVAVDVSTLNLSGAVFDPEMLRNAHARGRQFPIDPMQPPDRLESVGFWRSESNPGLPHPRDQVDLEWDAHEKARVADYVRSAYICAMYCGVAACRICDRLLGSCDMTDGTWRFPQGLEHYVLEHSVRLPEEFLDHLREAGYTLPRLRTLEG